MVASTTQNVYAEVVSGLRSLGYDGSLLAEDYRYADWFAPHMPERQVAAAAFAQTPISYDSACIGVVYANGMNGQSLVNQCRSLGAPIILEVAGNELREWAVARREDAHGLVDRYPPDRIKQLFANRASDWRPESLLRAKTIGSFRWVQQLGLFSGLLPELEEQIQEKLDPLLRRTLSVTKDAYRDASGRDPEPSQLFKLVFWMLTAKVFRDRRVNGFAGLGPDADVLLAAVAAKQYRSEVPRLLNREARAAAAAQVWNGLDFRNLSVEILSQIWSTTLVDDDTKRRLGIHRTSRTIVRYLIDRIPFEQAGDDRRIVLEPCSGSGVFLIGAMNALRHSLFGSTPAERHRYFVSHMAGIEKDPFGVEISRLALTLADFPNPDGWDIANSDVFDPAVLPNYLRRAGVVLCNPPFGDFDKDERKHIRPASPKKPTELLNRVLDDLHPRGVLGFVLPRNAIDGRGYAGVRQRLAERFANLELTILPDKAFEADPEVCLLVATDPIPHDTCRVANRKVNDDQNAWEQFELTHTVSSDHVMDMAPSQAAEGLGVPELPELWDFLINFPTLSEVAELHRGIEWNKKLTNKGKETGRRQELVRDKAAAGYKRGVPPLASFNAFEAPRMKYLDVRPEDQRGNPYKHAWDRPKAILNKAARSRGPWRMAAFPDSEGVTCYQTFIGVWPTRDSYDEWLLAAILNSPVANAFVATREGKTDITIETLRLIPVPHFTDTQADRLRRLTAEYRAVLSRVMPDTQHASRLLLEIDAVVLDGFRMPPRLERKLLDYFHGAERITPFPFGDYTSADDEVFFSLSDRLSTSFQESTAGALLQRLSSRKG